MKKIKLLFLAPSVIAMSVPAIMLPSSCKSSVTPASSFEWQTDDETLTATITRFVGSETHVVIPSEYFHGTKTYKVTKIGQYAFLQHGKVVSITIPNTVTVIGDGAFHSCESLVSINIPNSVIYIELLAFHGCKSLTHLTIGNSVESIGERAFSNCSLLESIIIPDSVKTIGDNAFQICGNLKEVTIGKSVETIGTYVFTYCKSLSDSSGPGETLGLRFNGTINKWQYVTIGENPFSDIENPPTKIKCLDGSCSFEHTPTP